MHSGVRKQVKQAMESNHISGRVKVNDKKKNAKTIPWNDWKVVKRNVNWILGTEMSGTHIPISTKPHAKKLNFPNYSASHGYGRAHRVHIST